MGDIASAPPESRPTKILPSAAVPPVSCPLAPDDWVLLNTGDAVFVFAHDGRTVSGLVDIVADDASIFWVLADDGAGRLAVHEEDGSRVWRIP